MSDDESSFLSRWSRLKRRARTPGPPPETPTPPTAVESAAAGATPGAPAEETVDPDSLPPIDSLGADSDFTQFLRKGVPAALKNAALRKLWAADPAIANYRTFAEYDWDFNAPGYGQLLPTDDVKTAVDALFKTMDRMTGDRMTGERPAAQGETASGPETAPSIAGDDEPARPAAATAEATPREPEPPLLPSGPLSGLPSGLAVPPDPVPVTSDPPPRRRRHGGAVPR